MRWIFFLLSMHGLAASACINMIDRVPGVSQEDVEFYYIGHIAVDADSLGAFIRFRKDQCAARTGATCNDLVIAYLFAKQFDSALDLSSQLVAKYPKNYSVVITHAAALELNGKVADAVPFMERAIALNPKSHKGSEWIHLNILKQRLMGDAGISPWALIGTDLRPDSALVKPDSVDLKGLVKQVHYQVSDRMYFTPEHDPLFGALVFAYADLLRLLGYRNQAKAEYERAMAYGFAYAWKAPEALSIPAPIANGTLQPTVSSAPPQPPADARNIFAEWMAGIFIAGVVVLVVVFVWKNSRTDS